MTKSINIVYAYNNQMIGNKRETNCIDGFIEIIS